MRFLVYVPLLLSGLFGVSAAWLAGRLPPRTATWLLSLGGLCAATATAISLALLSLTLLGQIPQVAQRGGWSVATLRSVTPVAGPVAVAAIIALLLATARVAQTTARWLATMVATHRLAAALPPGSGELTVIDSVQAEAFAVPGRPWRRDQGRIVVTSGLLRTLDAPQRRALLAHERAHLDHHHHLHQALTALSVAANPLLHRLRPAVELTCERWADEIAASTGNRSTVADALIRTAVGNRTRRPTAVLAAGATDVAARVSALRRPPPALELWSVALLLGLLLAATAAAVEATRDTDELFDSAQSAQYLQ